VLAALVFRRRPAAVRVAAAPVTPVVPNAIVPQAPARSARDRLQDALTVLRAERTRAAAVRVRSLVWSMVGASDGETLGDVLRRPDATEPAMRDLLRALERGAFTYEEDLPAAIDGACNALERYLA
jgi:hypothetical protein